MTVHILSARNLTVDTSPGMIGGKAAGLHALVGQALAVPDFVVVPTPAYRIFMAHPLAVAALGRFDARLREGISPYTIGGLADRLVDELMAVPMPESLAADLVAAIGPLLADGAVAVRSSATSEDGIEASGAGLHHTSLNVKSSQEVLEAIKECWRSLWSGPAVQYRIAHQTAEAAMAVVIQTQITPIAAGVVFSTNPVEPRNGAILEAVIGMGDALVSGETTPETWQQRPDGELSRTHDQHILTVEQARNLFDTTHSVATQQERPMDIEWAIDNHETLWLVQARPITTTQPTTQTATPSGRWTRSGFGEWFQRPLSPLFATTILPRFEAHTDQILSNELGIKRRTPTYSVIDRYLYSRAGIKASIDLLFAPSRALRLFARGIDAWDQAEAAHSAALNAATHQDPMTRLEAIVEANAQAWAWIVLTGGFAKIAVAQFELVHGLLAPNGPPSSDFLGGHPNTSVEADDALWELAAALGALSPNTEWTRSDLSDPETTASISGWISEYGHRALDLDPVYDGPERHQALAVSLLLTHLNHPTTRPLDKLDAALQRRRRALHWALDWFDQRPVRRRIFDRSHGLANRWSAVREQRPNALHRGWPPMAVAIDELASQLVADSSIDHRSDIYFLTRAELTGPPPDIGFGPRVTERRRAWLSAALRRPPDDRNLVTVERAVNYLKGLRRPTTRQHEALLVGRPASPGRAEGTARVVTNPKDWQDVKPGDIVVTELTTPAWTGLLAIAGAIVTQEGGALSHAAIIAREYNIPAVVGVGPTLPKKVTSGDQLIVDGTKGTVTSAPRSPKAVTR